jgi:hypothetical protein
MLSSTNVLTAGHCTVDAAFAWFRLGNPVDIVSVFVNFPNPPAWQAGTPHTHPSYDNFATFPNTSDVGVLVLDAPIVLAGYGTLASVGALDGLTTQRGRQNQIFDIVGYGDNGRFPFVGLDFANAIRYQGHPKLVELNSANTGGWQIHLSSNPGMAHRGGQCFGDSGGPAINPGTANEVVGVGSFVINQHCVGAGFYYRVDTAHAQNFINSF